MDDDWFSDQDFSKLVDKSTADPYEGSGVGSCLQSMLRWFGISPEGCQCKHHAHIMDTKGPEWCQDNIGEVLLWLESSAKESNIVWRPRQAHLLVQAAIWRVQAGQAVRAVKRRLRRVFLASGNDNRPDL